MENPAKSPPKGPLLHHRLILIGHEVEARPQPVESGQMRSIGPGLATCAAQPHRVNGDRGNGARAEAFRVKRNGSKARRSRHF